MFEHKEHISLILPIIPDTVTSRKSLRRYWNQLSRFQRNFIITITIASFLTTILLWNGENSILETNNELPKIQSKSIPAHIRVHHNTEKSEAINSNHINSNNYNRNNNNNNMNNVVVNSNNNNNNDENKIDKSENVLEQNNNQIESNDQNVEYKLEENNVEGVLDNLEHLADDKSFDRSHHNNDTPIEFKGPTNDRQRAVTNAFKHAWKGYKEFAWGHDNLKPISMGYSDWFGLGLTIVDALDTMYIMDLQDEFDEARNWVDEYLKFDVNRDVNLFEVTIRVLGGLLTAYHLSGDKMFLNKAKDLGTRLLPCFDSPSGIPYSDVNIGTLKAHSPKWSPDSSTSEVTTIQLEFRDLARSISDPNFGSVVETINEKVHNLEKNHGLVPIFINANSGTFRSFATISLGARGDSYYEYLLKQWLQSGKKANDYLIQDYQNAIDGVLSQLMRKTPNEHHIYIGELINGKDFKPKMDHLTCYLPGTLFLGYRNGMPEKHFTLAKDLLETCYQTYMKQPTLLAPEITYFNMQGESETDLYVKSNDAHNLLRPEFIESLYYFYALTGNRTYQDMGWTIFEAFEKHTRVKNGYTSISNVKSVLNTRPRDLMESFFLGETLKYFYLLFSDDPKEIDLDRYVFNTEAHPLPIWKN